MRLAQLINAMCQAGPDPVRTGEQPHPSIEQRILTEIVKRHRPGGNYLEAAVREGIRLGWRARHDLYRYQQKARK